MRQSLNNRLANLKLDPTKRAEVPTKEQLQIDIDGERALLLYGRQRAMIERRAPKLCEFWTSRIHPSFTAGHVHITLDVKEEWSAYKRIAYAACLGSDPVRELLNLIRLEKRQPVPIAFFEPIEPPTQKIIVIARVITGEQVQDFVIP